MCSSAGSTLCPIPIGGRPLEAAPFHERIFEILNVVSVPLEEQSRVVDLSIGLKGRGNREHQRYLVVQGHMQIYNV